MLPTATKYWILHHACSDQRGLESFRRALILRWMLWQDGHAANSIPGYDTPPPDCGLGHPAGWSKTSFKRLAAKREEEPV